MATLILNIEVAEDTALTGDGLYIKIDLTEKLARSIERRVRLLTSRAAGDNNVTAISCRDGFGQLTVFREYPDMKSTPDNDGALTMQEALLMVGNSVVSDLSLPRGATDGLIAIQPRMVVYLAPGGPRIRWRFLTSNGVELFTGSISAAVIEDTTTRPASSRGDDNSLDHGPAFEYTVPWGDVQMLRTGANTVDAVLKGYALEMARRTAYRIWQELVASYWWGVISIDPQVGYKVRLYVGDIVKQERRPV